MKIKHIFVDLSLFDGGADGGATAGESSGNATESAAETQSGEATESSEESAADSQPTEEERIKAYQDFKKQYKDLYAKDFQETFNRRFKDAKNLEKQLEEYRPLMDMLGQRYGTNDVASAIKAMEEDNAYWEQAAYDAGMSVEQYKIVSKLQRENAALLRAQQEALQEQETYRIAEEWRAQEEEMRATYPDFDVNTEIQMNPDFARLIQNGVPIKHAFEVTHIDDIKTQLMQYTAQQTAKAVTDDIRANGNRPVENGASSQNAFTQKVDVSKLTDKEMDEYIKRARRGETISFG